MQAVYVSRMSFKKSQLLLLVAVFGLSHQTHHNRFGTCWRSPTKPSYLLGYFVLVTCLIVLPCPYAVFSLTERNLKPVFDCEDYPLLVGCKISESWVPRGLVAYVLGDFSDQALKGSLADEKC
jgi:hypothetical protein